MRSLFKLLIPLSIMAAAAWSRGYYGPAWRGRPGAGRGDDAEERSRRCIRSRRSCTLC